MRETEVRKPSERTIPKASGRKGKDGVQRLPKRALPLCAIDGGDDGVVRGRQDATNGSTGIDGD